jgi:hypothetical protein
MINLFLRAKHWQIFLLSFGLPFVLQIALVITVVSSLIQNHDVTFLLGVVKFLPAMVILFMAVHFGWQWSVVMGLQKLMPAGVPNKLTQFKIFFFIPVAYILVICVLLALLFNSDMMRGGQPNPAIFMVFPIIFPVHLFAMFCIFYNIYFVAKTLRTAELQREVVFNDFMAEFFLVWFHFIGIWILQPRINKLAEDERGSDTVVDTGL